MRFGVSRAGGVRTGRSALRATPRDQHCAKCRLARSAYELVARYHLSLADAPASEHVHQVAFVAWCDWMGASGQIPELGEIFAIPNAAKRHPLIGAAMVAEGMRRGVNDLMLLVPRRGFAGLMLEDKRPAEARNGIGSVDTAQRAWLRRFVARGFSGHVAFGVHAMIAVALWYFERLPGAVTHGAVLELPLSPSMALEVACRIEVLAYDDLRLWRPQSAHARAATAGQASSEVPCC